MFTLKPQDGTVCLRFPKIEKKKEITQEKAGSEEQNGK